MRPADPRRRPHESSLLDADGLITISQCAGGATYLLRKPKGALKVCKRGAIGPSPGGVEKDALARSREGSRWRGCDPQRKAPLGTEFAFIPPSGAMTRPQALHQQMRTSAAMRIYDIEFDIDSFLDEMEEMQRARRQRQQQIHRSADVVGGINEGPRDRDAD